jgi:hypothetical protein
MKQSFFRLTPKRTLTLNNRWPHIKVKPKHTIFFLPLDYKQIELWKDFLCVSHHKSFLFLHEVYVEFHLDKYNTRTLTYFKDSPLNEIMIKHDGIISIHNKKTIKVFHSIPANLRYFTNIPVKNMPITEPLDIISREEK